MADRGRSSRKTGRHDIAGTEDSIQEPRGRVWLDWEQGRAGYREGQTQAVMGMGAAAKELSTPSWNNSARHLWRLASFFILAISIRFAIFQNRERHD